MRLNKGRLGKKKGEKEWYEVMGLIMYRSEDVAHRKEGKVEEKDKEGGRMRPWGGREG